MKPEVRLWKTNAKIFIPRITASEITHYFQIDCVFHYQQHHKNGSLKKFDSPNLLKVLIDAIAEKIGFKDELVKFGSWKTFNNEKECVEVTVSKVFEEE